MAFSRQGCWSGEPLPSPGDVPNLETEPRSSALQADSLPSETPRKSFIEFLKIRDEAQAVINIVGRNINNLSYADDTTLYSRKQRRTKEPLDEGESCA